MISQNQTGFGYHHFAQVADADSATGRRQKTMANQTEKHFQISNRLFNALINLDSYNCKGERCEECILFGIFNSAFDLDTGKYSRTACMRDYATELLKRVDSLKVERMQ